MQSCCIPRLWGLQLPSKLCHYQSNRATTMSERTLGHAGIVTVSGLSELLWAHA
jgi:hypothetical protein